MAKENRPTENLRSLYYQMFLNFMNADGLMAKAIINNYKQKQTNGEKNGNTLHIFYDRENFKFVVLQKSDKK